jgi:hypothetical protein
LAEFLTDLLSEWQLSESVFDDDWEKWQLETSFVEWMFVGFLSGKPFFSEYARRTHIHDVD